MKLQTALCALIILVLLIGWIGFSAMEARHYTRMTGNEVSTWEAMWVELRVVSTPSKGMGF